jgi:hypothetical protein
MKVTLNQILSREIIASVCVVMLAVACKSSGPKQSSINNADVATGADEIATANGVTEKIHILVGAQSQFLEYSSGRHALQPKIVPTYLQDNRASTWDSRGTYELVKIKGGKLLIVFSKDRCLTNKGYKQVVEFEPCDENRADQQMSWNPSAPSADPLGAFIKNGTLCLDIGKNGPPLKLGYPTTDLVFGLDYEFIGRFWNCKDHPGEAGTNYNQRFYKRPYQ